MSGDKEYYAIKTAGGQLITWTACEEIIPCYQRYIDYLVDRGLFDPKVCELQACESFEGRNCRLWMVLKKAGYKIVQVTRDVDKNGPYQVCYLTEVGEGTQEELF